MNYERGKIWFPLFLIESYVLWFFMCRIIGAVLIIVGLYLVLWGKSEEKKFAAKEKAMIQSTPDHGSNRSTTHIKTSLTQPLLPPSTENV